MALGDVIARLSVVLGMDTAAFEQGATIGEKRAAQMSRRLDNLGSRVGALGTKLSIGLLAGLTAAGAGMIKLATDSINLADDMFKAAQSIGIGTEELSRLKYAADLSGLTFEQLQANLAKLNRGMLDTSRGTGTARIAFEALGISVKDADGKMKSSTDILKEVADRFQRMPDGVEKSATAMQLFGRSGAAMIPMLNAGSDALTQLTEEADRFGVVIDEETGRKAEQFNDNLARLQGIVGNIGAKVAAELLPQLLDLSQYFIDNADRVTKAAVALGDFGIRAARGISEAVIWVTTLTERVNAAVPALGRLDAWAARNGLLPWARGTETAAHATGGLTSGLRTMIQAVQNTREVATVGLNDIAETATRSSARAGSAIASAMREAARESERALADIQRVLDRVFPEVARLRAYKEDVALLTQADLPEGQRSQALSTLLGELGGLQPGAPIAYQIDVGAKDIEPQTNRVQDALKDMADRARDSSVRIAKSMKDMADETLNALSRMTSAIQGGGFLDILSSVIGLGMQLGSIGVFGKDIATKLNKPVKGYAKGTNYAPGGLALVGERGAELVDLPRGSRVTPNHAIGRGGNTYNFSGNLLTPEFWGVIQAGDAAAVEGGASTAMSRSALRQSRSLG
jgi:hypothetical protein